AKLQQKNKAKNRQIKIEPHFCPLERNEQKLTSLLSIRPKMLLDKKTEILDKQMNNAFTVENYTVDCKVILVNEGTTVGMFTFNYCNCSEAPCAIEVRAYRYGSKKYWINPESDESIVRTEGETQWYSRVNFVAKLNDISEILSRDLVKILQGK
ncbi:MAG: hypothetical protein LBJ63_02095, partial [Prevotellaceae bacterium]|nr:hypothetical protein [Prevotellaceae bacterium]